MRCPPVTRDLDTPAEPHVLVPERIRYISAVTAGRVERFRQRYGGGGEALAHGVLPASAAGEPARGSWQQVFGSGPEADEIFMAWHFARFTQHVTAAGKAEYPLPMYVNAALRDPFTPGLPGQYESGGPTDNVLDIYKLAAPNIDGVDPKRAALKLTS